MDGMRSSDLRTALEAQRDHLVGCLEECDPDKAAPLHARLTDVLVRLHGMSAPEVSASDDIARAREARRKRRTGS